MQIMNKKSLKSMFSNKNVLITGHTGFKGAWLSLILKFYGAKIYGISRDKKTIANFHAFFL